VRGCRARRILRGEEEEEKEGDQTHDAGDPGRSPFALVGVVQQEQWEGEQREPRQLEHRVGVHPKSRRSLDALKMSFYYCYYY